MNQRVTQSTHFLMVATSRGKRDNASVCRLSICEFVR